MRKIFSITGLLILSCGLQAQTWDEWFEQRKTQRKYLVDQIAALKVYAGYLQKGYEVAGNGLTFINAIKNGDFDQHNGFFHSLGLVNPAIRNSSVVADIISMQRHIVKLASDMIDLVNECKQFTGPEIVHFKKVIDRLLDDCFGGLAELLTVITNGELEMRDDERMQRIEKIRREMEERSRFCRTYAEDARRLAIQRLAEGMEVERSRKLFGLN